MTVLTNYQMNNQTLFKIDDRKIKTRKSQEHKKDAQIMKIDYDFEPCGRSVCSAQLLFI